MSNLFPETRAAWARLVDSYHVARALHHANKAFGHYQKARLLVEAIEIDRVMSSKRDIRFDEWSDAFAHRRGKNIQGTPDVPAPRTNQYSVKTRGGGG